MLYTLLSRIRFNVSMSPYKSLLGHLEAKVSQEYLCYEQLTHQNKSMLMYLFFLIWYNPWLHVETFYFSFNFTAFFFPFNDSSTFLLTILSKISQVTCSTVHLMFHTTACFSLQYLMLQKIWNMTWPMRLDKICYNPKHCSETWNDLFFNVL